MMSRTTTPPIAACRAASGIHRGRNMVNTV
jgi:hypothetical protein